MIKRKYPLQIISYAVIGGQESSFRVHYKSIMGLKAKRECKITHPEMYVREILPKIVYTCLKSIKSFMKKKKNTTKESSIFDGSIICIKQGHCFMS